MPELPEVQTIVQDLREHLTGRRISGLQVFNKSSLNLSTVKFKQGILPAKVVDITRRGKHIIIALNNQRCLLIHLKMTGQLVWQSGRQMIAGGHPIVGVGQTLPNRFTRIEFIFNNGGRLFFNDVRKFGWIKLLDKTELADYLAKLGLEPLGSDFSWKKFQTILSSRPKSKIKALLLDQTQIAGLGNIYADEVLYSAKIRPQRLIGSLSNPETKRLWQAIPRILKQAIKYRGTSFNDYIDAQGQTGNFIEHLHVYGRAGKKCRRCGGKISKTKLAGRGIHWCPQCQK